MMNGKFRHTPSAKWRNKFPIVLVHGYYGYGPDSSTMLGNYFEYALRTQVAKHFEEDLYIAVVSPAQGIHDRACELYQQLVGINNLRREWSLEHTDNGPNLIKAVYGPQHFYEDHQHQRIFKPRYLRQQRGTQEYKQLIAFPDGLPGGWNDVRKVHFIAHSQGAETVRYLQYLLSIDYF